MSEVFDLLVSMGDFESFKEVMMSYKAEMAGAGPLGGGDPLRVSVTALKVGGVKTGVKMGVKKDADGEWQRV